MEQDKTNKETTPNHQFWHEENFTMPPVFLAMLEENSTQPENDALYGAD